LVIKLKKCRAYDIFFFINIVLYGLINAFIKVLEDKIFFKYIGLPDKLQYEFLFFLTAIVLQILWFLSFLFLIRSIREKEASYSRKFPTEFVFIFSFLYTVFLISLYKSPFYIGKMIAITGNFGVIILSTTSQLVLENLSVFICNLLLMAGYLLIITFLVIKMKGNYLKQDSLFARLQGAAGVYSRKNVKSIYLNDIIFVFSELLVLVYEICICFYINKHAADYTWQSLFFAMVVLPLTAEALLVLWRCRTVIKTSDILTLVEGIHKLAGNGRQLDNGIPKSSYLFETGEELKRISKHLSDGIQKQVKNEKLKVDLITNLSHDLKTPLTSIIGYADLLSAKDYFQEEDRHYLSELQKKAGHLGELINLMFELSKASSGNLKIDKTRLNLNKLVMQTLADLDDNIVKSGFDIKTIYTEENTEFYGDGTKLYLVCQNLINNALKYSLTGSRIYIKTYSQESDICFMIQNTSCYEINFTSEEIMGRFVRGDESRSDGGNGLGLSIAKTYTEACSGEFNLIIDGDMFKVIIKFPRDDSGEI
jgi:Signal transduction histidine kinase